MYIILILIFIVYAILIRYYTANTSATSSNTNQLETSTTTTDVLLQNDCNTTTVYCACDLDCEQLCTTTKNNNNAFAVKYKCNETDNICAQSQLAVDKPTDTTLSCNQQYGFYPVLTLDEFTKPHWVCLNTRPQLFNAQQQYHPYICAGGDYNKLDPDNIYETCKCLNNKIKARDEFRPNIPLCLFKRELSLYPNIIEE